MPDSCRPEPKGDCWIITTDGEKLPKFRERVLYHDDGETVSVSCWIASEQLGKVLSTTYPMWYRYSLKVWICQSFRIVWRYGNLRAITTISVDDKACNQSQNPQKRFTSQWFKTKSESIAHRPCICNLVRTYSTGRCARQPLWDIFIVWYHWGQALSSPRARANVLEWHNLWVRSAFRDWGRKSWKTLRSCETLA